MLDASTAERDGAHFKQPDVSPVKEHVWPHTYLCTQRHERFAYFVQLLNYAGAALAHVS